MVSYCRRGKSKPTLFEEEDKRKLCKLREAFPIQRTKEIEWEKCDGRSVKQLDTLHSLQVSNRINGIIEKAKHTDSTFSCIEWTHKYLAICRHIA